MKAQRGFTLIEMMVVVAIIGILTSLAIVYVKPKTTALDIANRVGDLIHLANQRAIAGGPVRADVVTARQASGDLHPRSRTRITASGGASASPTFTAYILVEGAIASPGTYTWTPIQTYVVDAKTVGVAYGPGAGSYAALSGVLQTGGWTNFAVNCYTDGTCDAYTLFFQAVAAARTGGNYQSKLAIMPLGGAITFAPNWL